jgi:selenocysteine-specific elongation factor
LKEPLPAVKGDLFVVRSADATLGGGKVVDPHPARRHRRFLSPIIQRLTAMDEGSEEESLLSAVDHWGPCDLKTLSQKANISLDEADSGVRELADQGLVIVLGDGSGQVESVIYSVAAWELLKGAGVKTAGEYHSQHPLRRGLPREELRSRLGLSPQAFPPAMDRLAAEGVLEEDGAWVRLPGHEAKPSQHQQSQMDAYLKALQAEPYSPPTDYPLDAELLALLTDEGKVIRVSDSVVFSAGAYRRMVEKVKEHIAQRGKITVADGRDLFGTSRKYVLPLLEYLDQQHVTRRVGDERVLR